MSTFEASLSLVEELLAKGKQASKRKSLVDSGIEPKCMRAYGMIARRCREEKDFGLRRYPYKPVASVGAFRGGFFEHREWPVRKAMEKHNGMRPVLEYEANYTNASGYWMAFTEAAVSMRKESIEEKKDSQALLFEFWAYAAVRYELRVSGLRFEFYRMMARVPTYAKLIMPSLEQRNEHFVADV